MPNSRRRRRSKSGSRRGSGNPSISQGDRDRAFADLPLLVATDDAEARGDAAAALALIEQDLAHRDAPDFWRPWRVRALLQLSFFGASLPRWVTSRWVVAQAAQHLDPRTRTRFHRATEIAIATRSGPEAEQCRHDLEARIRLMDHDWVFRQVWLYELGALEHFVTHVAAPDLLAGADHIHDWVRTPMGAFSFAHASPQSLTLRDLGSGEAVTALNIGAASLLEEGDCLIGRLVPIAGGSMFETAPLFVPARTAQQVAEEPSEWVAAVAAACATPSLTATPRLITTMPEFGLVTDVPGFLQAALAIAVAHHGGVEVAPDPLRFDVTSAGVNLVRAALENRLPPTIGGGREAPIIAAWWLDPAVYAEVASRLTPGEAERLLRLADRLADPAASLCRELARKLDAAA